MVRIKGMFSYDYPYYRAWRNTFGVRKCASASSAVSLCKSASCSPSGYRFKFTLFPFLPLCLASESFTCLVG